jgi:hypothetical protein
MNMFMRAVFASAMLIGLAGTAQAETRIIYPPYSYKPPMNLCDYVLGDYCGYNYTDGYYGYPYHRYDAAVVPHEAYANIAKVVVILPRFIDERSRHWNYRGYTGW